MHDPATTLAFSLCLAKVSEKIASDNYNNINAYINDCVLSYDKNYAEVTASQIVQLLSVIWGSKPDINFHPLHRVMKPFLDGRMKTDFLVPHYEDPALVRSLLMLSAIMDGSKPDVDSVPPSVKPEVEKILTSVHNTDISNALLPTRLERTGYSLMGDNWHILQTVLDLPRTVQWQLCEALRGLPDDLLGKPKLNLTNTTSLPSSLSFD